MTGAYWIRSTEAANSTISTREIADATSSYIASSPIRSIMPARSNTSRGASRKCVRNTAVPRDCECDERLQLNGEFSTRRLPYPIMV